MKNSTCKFLSILTLLLLALAACEDGNDFGEGYTPSLEKNTTPNPVPAPDELTISPTSLNIFDAEGGTQTVTVTANNAWSMSVEYKGSSTGWLNLSPSPGDFSSGTKSISITASENTSTDSRNATITFTCGTATPVTLTVTQEKAQTTEDVQTFTANGVSFNMILVEHGTFQMGSTDGDSDEKPVHQVSVSSFSIGQTEVTQELWEAVMGTNPSYIKGLKLPVERVSWNDCQEFIAKLNQLTGKTFRLPTEAEWEFAARGGNSSKGYTYAGSNTIDDVAWYYRNSSSKTHEVATKQANELGIYDMSGNVWEWCSDWYGRYSSDAQTNPTGAASGSTRVYRGGSWSYYATYCRVAYRNGNAPTDAYFNLGFRLAL